MANERQLVQARTAAAGCPCRCRFVERCLARDVERWEAELVWLERLAEGLATPQRRRGRPGQADVRTS